MSSKCALIMHFADRAEMERFWESLQIAGLSSGHHGPDDAVFLGDKPWTYGEQDIYLCERKDDAT